MTMRHNGRTATIVPQRRRPILTAPPPRPVNGATQQLWASIPQDLADKVRPMSGLLVQDAIREIQKAVPAYRQPMQGKFREVLVGAVEMAIVKCFDNICDPDADQADWQAVFRYTGRVEFLEGRTMDAVQTAIRVGSRAVWRRLSVTGQRMGVSPQTLFTVADAIFAWVDEISTVAIEGYTEAQAHATGALERRRRQLLKLILSSVQIGRASCRERV